jgi:flagellar motor switch protein FliG
MNEAAVASAHTSGTGSSSAKIAPLKGVRKAAVLMMALGAKAAASVFQHMNELEVELITRELVNTQDITGEMIEEILIEYERMIVSQQYIAHGGADYARTILEEALNPVMADDILNRVKNRADSSGFTLACTLDPAQLLNVIQNEHPQTIALVLAHIEPIQAATILSQLSPQLQVEVPYRMATMERISPEAMGQVERVLEAQVASMAGGGQEVSAAGGIKMVADIMNLVDRSAEKHILEGLVQRNSELAMNIKNLMFVFEDILLLDDRSVVRVLREVQTRDLSLALKAASEEVKAKIFRNVSQRVATMINEEMEFMGPVRLREVEEAQQRIAEIIRSLEEAGEIVISGRDGGKDDMLV